MDDITSAGCPAETTPQTVLHPAGVEPLSAAVQFGPTGAQGPRRANPVPATKCLLPQEGRGQDQGPQISRASLRRSKVQHSYWQVFDKFGFVQSGSVPSSPVRLSASAALV